MIRQDERPHSPGPAKPRAGDQFRVWRTTRSFDPPSYVLVHSRMNSIGLPRGQHQVWATDGAAYRIFWDANFSEWREVPQPPQPPRRRYGQR